MPDGAPPRRRVPQGDAPDPRRDELLRVAREVFSERGFEQAKMRDIAGRMGLLGGSLYYYVDSKQALLGEVMAELQGSSSELLEGVLDATGPADETLRTLIERHTLVIAEDPLGVTLVLTERQRLTDDQRASVARSQRSYRHGVQELLVQGGRDGTLRSDVDAHLGTMVLLGVTNWTARWMRADGPLGAERIGSDLATLVLDGFAVDGARVDGIPADDAPHVPRPDAGGRRGEIMRTAAELFNRRGFRAASMADLAARVGIGKASLYHYFPTKEALLFAVLDEAQQAAEDGVSVLAAADAPAIDRLHASIRFNVRYAAEVLDATSLALHAYGSLGPAHRDRMRAAGHRYTSIFHDLVDAAVREGAGRRTVDAGVVTRGILGAANWMYRWYRPDGATDPARIADVYADALLLGLRPRDGR